MRTTILVSSVLFFFWGYHVFAMDIITHINESAVLTSKTDYGDRLLIELDLMAQQYHQHLAKIEQDELIQLLDGDSIQDDAKFLLLCSRIRIRNDVDESLVKDLSTSGFRVLPMSGFASYVEDGSYSMVGLGIAMVGVGLKEREVRGWTITVNGSTDIPHVLALTTHHVSSMSKAERSRLSPRITCNWWIFDRPPPGSNVVLRRIERGWHTSQK